MGKKKRKKKHVGGKNENKKKFVRLQPPRLELFPIQGNFVISTKLKM